MKNRLSRLACVVTALSVGCGDVVEGDDLVDPPGNGGKADGLEDAASLAAISQILTDVEPGPPRLHPLAADSSGAPELSSLLLLDNLESVSVAWQTLADYPQGIAWVDAKTRHASGTTSARWDHLRAASYNAETGYVLFEPATNSLHFAGYPDSRTDAPFVYTRQTLIGNQQATKTSAMFQVQDATYDESRALPAVSVDTQGMLHMAAVLDIEDGLAWMHCDPATPDDCYGSHELVALGDHSMYAVAVSAVGSSPVVAWLERDGSRMAAETRYRNASGQWQDLGQVLLPAEVLASFSTEPTLQFRQGYGRLLMFVQAPDYIYNLHDGGDVLIYELEDSGWTLQAHLTYPYTPNWQGGSRRHQNVQFRLSPAGFVVLTSACVEVDDEGQCLETGWRFYREDTAEMSQLYGHRFTAGVDGIVYTPSSWGHPAAPVVGAVLPRANGETNYPKLPVGRTALGGPDTLVSVNLSRSYDSWLSYSASGDARISCSLTGNNPGLLRLSCLAKTPPFSPGPSTDLSTICVRDIDATPSAVECDSASGLWRGTVDVDLDGAHFTISSLRWWVPAGSSLTQTIDLPARVDLRPQP